MGGGGAQGGSSVARPESYTKEGEEWELDGSNDGQEERAGQEVMGGGMRNERLEVWGEKVRQGEGDREVMDEKMGMQEEKEMGEKSEVRKSA